MSYIINENESAYIHSDSCSDVEHILKNENNSGLMEAALERLGKDYLLTQPIGWAESENIETLYTRFNSFERTEEEVRDSIKAILCGSELPRINVMRSQVQQHITSH